MRVVRFASLAVAMMLLATACGEKETAVEQTSTASPDVTAGQAAQAEPITPPAGSVQTSVPPSAGVIASTDAETEGIRIDVTQFERASGDTVNLRFVLVNESAEELGMTNHMTDSTMGEYNTVGGIHLVDPVNKRKYFVVRDADRKCVCSRDVSAVDPGKKATLWAKFPAPPADVQRISIVFPKFLPLDDVPLQ
ncbi:MAG TPA: hypothetical protein VMS12_09075 [Thermoanaerobaculia bacterium]|nr:hypothetical protein [Thermoanaerobaculia bacterium]